MLKNSIVRFLILSLSLGLLNSTKSMQRLNDSNNFITLPQELKNIILLQLVTLPKSYNRLDVG
ncbi:hypothetical protein H0X48_02220 [Candidatus Dependentiae bacterium]|nr:hypothetical protein [Candidatus Dependentiae bacterium]